MLSARRASHLLSVLVLSAAFTASCSDSASDTSDHPSEVVSTDSARVDGDVCALVSVEELRAIVGKPLAAGESGTEGSANTCRWESTEPSANPDIEEPFFVLLAILPLTAADKATLAELAADTEHNVVLEGLGDSALVQCAFSSTDGCPWRDKVFVSRGDQYLMVDVGNFSSPDDFESGQIEELVVAIAEVAAPRF